MGSGTISTPFKGVLTLKHECMIDNEWDIDIKCHKCKRKLTPRESEMCWDYLKINTW